MVLAHMAGHILARAVYLLGGYVCLHLVSLTMSLLFSASCCGYVLLCDACSVASDLQLFHLSLIRTVLCNVAALT